MAFFNGVEDLWIEGMWFEAVVSGGYRFKEHRVLKDLPALIRLGQGHGGVEDGFLSAHAKSSGGDSFPSGSRFRFNICLLRLSAPETGSAGLW